MNKLTKTLLGGAALAALAAAPATAGKLHGMHVTAMHAGKAVNKSKIHNNGRTHITYTFGVYTYQPADAPPGTHLSGTFYKWNSSGNICSNPKEKIKAPHKSVYAKIGTLAQTYSIGCSNGPTTFYGDTWTNKKGVAGNTDTFRSTLTGKFQNGGAARKPTRYIGTLNLDVDVFIQ